MRFSEAGLAPPRSDGTRGEYVELVPGDSLVHHLDEPTHRSVLAAGRELTVDAGSFVVHDGDSDDSVFLVRDGLLKVVKASLDGQVSFIGLRGTGTLVGELAALTGSTRTSSVQAVCPTTVVRIETDRFERLLADHADFGRALLTEIAVCIRDSTSQIHDLMNADATTRIAARLTQLADDIVGDGDNRVTLSLPISQEELGNWTGLSRAGTVKALRVLRTDGLIETSRMAITINDLPGLRIAAVV